MFVYLRSGLTVVWGLVALITLVSWWLGARGEGVGTDASVLLLVVAIALVKSRLIFSYFMEVRHGPRWLRWNCDGWLLFVGAMIVALWELGS